MLQELVPYAVRVHHGSCGGGRGCCGGPAASSAFSLLLPMAGGRYYCHYRQCGAVRRRGGGGEEEEEEEGGSTYGGLAAVVDCTLSLGTPSTRVAGLASCRGVVPLAPERAGGKQDGGGVGVLPGTRRCANCDATSTPLWRKGPRGPMSLCNACGIRHEKKERRAGSAAAVAPAPLQNSYARWPLQWGCYGPAAGKSASNFAVFPRGGGRALPVVAAQHGAILAGFPVRSGRTCSNIAS